MPGYGTPPLPIFCPGSAGSAAQIAAVHGAVRPSRCVWRLCSGGRRRIRANPAAGLGTVLAWWDCRGAPCSPLLSLATSRCSDVDKPPRRAALGGAGGHRRTTVGAGSTLATDLPALFAVAGRRVQILGGPVRADHPEGQGDVVPCKGHVPPTLDREILGI